MIRNIYGSHALLNAPPAKNGAEVLWFDGTFFGTPSGFGMTQDQLDTHSLLAGSTGCGKTTLMNRMIDQIRQKMTKNDVLIIFDSKGDFYSRFGPVTDCKVIGNSPAYYASSARWNVFREICADGWEDPACDRFIVSNAQELCRELFADREKRTNNPFFPNAARDLLASLLIYLIRTGRDEWLNSGKTDASFRREFFRNDSLQRLLNRTSPDRLLDFFGRDPDLRSVSSYIEGGGDQAKGVLAEMYSVTRDIFSGIFAENGGFSIRDFVRKKGGKTLFIEYDLSRGQVLTPLYRLLFDLALKEALGRQQNEGNVYLFCDEFRLLPHLEHIDDGVNFGRSLGVKIFAGIQSVEQLFELYGESRGRSILAGFSNLFLFHANDPSTLNYAAERSGKIELLQQYTRTDGTLGDMTRSTTAVEDHDVISLQKGDAIVSLAFGLPFRFHFHP